MARKSRANNALIISDTKNKMWNAGLYSAEKARSRSQPCRVKYQSDLSPHKLKGEPV